MTVPGLAVYYGGLVRAKNVLSVAMQCFSIAAVVGVLWMIVGYSLVFGEIPSSASSATWSTPFSGTSRPVLSEAPSRRCCS